MEKGPEKPLASFTIRPCATWQLVSKLGRLFIRK